MPSAIAVAIAKIVMMCNIFEDLIRENFWNTASLKTINSEKQIHANVDGKAVVVSESSVRRDLHLNDEDGTACLTVNEIFENLALMIKYNYLSILLPSLPLKSPVYHEPSVASVVSASVVDRSIGIDNPHLSLGSQADLWCIEHLSYMAKIQEVSPKESSSTSQPLEQKTMAEQNVPTQPPTRTDEQFALAITPVIPAQPFELPPSGNTVIDFVNELGYPEPVEIERLLAVTNQTRSSGKCCGGIDTQTNVDHAELRRTQRKKVTPLPYSLWTVFQGNLKFVPKAQQESIPQEEGDDPDLELAKKMSLEAHQEKGEGEGDDADMERAIKLSLDPAFLPQGQAPVGGVTIRDPVSETTPKLPKVVGKGKAIVTEETIAHSMIDLLKKEKEQRTSLSLLCVISSSYQQLTFSHLKSEIHQRNGSMIPLRHLFKEQKVKQKPLLLKVTKIK
ncbi:hypothetical protein Tco_0639792 [Tanacetum coccineum]